MKILIKQCKDPMLWYADLIGQTVPYFKIVHGPTEYMSREPDGYVNFVRFEDGELVEDEGY
jgi:hypothetical protein